MKIDDELEGLFEFESAIYTDNLGQQSCVLTEEINHCADLRLVVKVVEKLVRFRKPIFSVFPAGKRTQSLELSVLNILGVNIHGIKCAYPNHKLNPLVDAFFRLEDGLINKLDSRVHSQLSRNDKAMLSSFVEKLVAEVRSPHVQARLHGFSRVANKNNRELMNYIESLFCKYSRLLVVRLDVGFRNKYCNPAGVLSVHYQDAKNYLKDLLVFLRGMKSPEMIGYVWKLEYGLDKGYHYHLLLFFDGSKSQQDITIANKIGQQWKGEITRGKGIYYNCNANKQFYKELGALGIGMINYDDLFLRKGLVTAASYLTKVDYFVRMVIPGGGRCFGKGGKPSAKSHLGRPRLSASRPVDTH